MTKDEEIKLRTNTAKDIWCSALASTNLAILDFERALADAIKEADQIIAHSIKKVSEVKPINNNPDAPWPGDQYKHEDN